MNMVKTTGKPSLVTVVVPVYNVEDYIEECFQSIVCQTYRNIEIILIDDGSTDRSGLLADKITATDKRAVVIHKSNGGLSDARNVGLRAAKGEFITFIDSDDYIDSRFVASLVNAMDDNTDISQCNNTRDESKIGLGSGSIMCMSGECAFHSLLKFKSISPTAWGKLYRTSLFFENCIEFPVGRLHEDTAIMYKLVYFARSIRCINKSLYFYRKNDSSIMTSKYSYKYYNSVEQYHDELEEFIHVNDINVSRSFINKHKAMRYLSVINKMALSNMDNSMEFKRIKTKYIEASHDLNIVRKVIGFSFVEFPELFRVTKNMMPTIRRLIGKT